MSSTPTWLHEPALQQLFAAAEARGGEIRAVGGCVRDFLLGIAGGDIDLASTLHPEIVMQMAEEQGWKAVPTGLAHGTVTVVLPGRAVEITTLRRDVSTDGRHAQIAFTTHFEEDAARRDFTMNALYMDRYGIIDDFYDGAADIAAQQVRFIGDAHARIREDGLRILRYFRFLATHGKPPAEVEALAACTHHKFMLEKLSGERIQQEMKKLLGAVDPSYALAQMALMAFGEALTTMPWKNGLLQRLLQLEAQHKLAPSPWVRLLVLVPAEQRINVAAYVCTRWRLSRADTQVLEFLTAPPPLPNDAAIKEALRHYKRDWIMDALLLNAVDDETLSLNRLLPVARSFETPVCPVTARDLLARGMREGPELGALLRSLERRWIDSDYRLSAQELLNG